MKTNKINSKEACTLAHKIRRETGCSLAEAFKQAYSGTPTAAPTYYTQQDLDKIFSDKTAELIKKGYMIHVPTMSGSQGEMAYITFIKNNQLYRLSMDKEYIIGSNCCIDSYVTIRLGKSNDNEAVLNGRTFWKNDITVIWSLNVAKVNSWRRSKPQETRFIPLDRVEECEAKAKERALNKYSNCDFSLSEKSHPAALTWVRAHRGYKGTKLTDIKKVTKIYNGSYNIEIEKNGNTIHMNTKTDKINKRG